MFRLFLFIVACAWLSLSGPVNALADPPPLLSLLPDDAFAVLTVRDGVHLADQFAGSAYLAAFVDDPLFERVSAQQPFIQAQAGLALVAGLIGVEPWELVGQALGREMALALLPAVGGQPALVAVQRPGNAELARRVLDGVIQMSGPDAREPASRRSREVEGVRGYELGPGAFVADVDGLLVFSSQARALERVIRQHRAKDGKLVDDRTFAAAQAAVPASAAAWLYVDLKRVRSAPRSRLDAPPDNALGAFLIGGASVALRESDALAAWLRVEPTGVELRGKLLGTGSQQRDAFRRPLNDGALTLPQGLASVELRRDWLALWEQREPLLTENGLRQLLNFASVTTTIMGGLDFSGELLPALGPGVQLVAANVAQGDPAPTPLLPGFALVLELKESEKITPRLMSAAHSALGLINLDRGQKMQEPLLIDLAMHAGERMLVSTFAEEAEPGPRGLRYNFQPSLAIVKDRFIVSSSRTLLEKLIDAVKQPHKDKAAGAERGDALRLDFSELGKVLRSNRSVLVQNRILDEGLSRGDAELQVDLALWLVESLRELQAQMAHDGEDFFALRLGWRSFAR